MKRSFIFILALLLVCLAGCPAPAVTTKPSTTVAQTTAPSGTEPGESTQTEATVPSVSEPVTEQPETEPAVTEPSKTEPPATVPTEPELPEGWEQIDGQWYFYEAGIPHMGWLNLGDGLYWFGADGAMCTGWVEVEGAMRFFTENGPLGSGWLEQDGVMYYLDQGGIPVTGWLELENQTYYFGSEGTMHTGWLEADGDRYYFKENGAMGRGKVTVTGGETRYFTSSGKEVILVNPWNYVPEDYEPTLGSHLDYWQVAQEALAPLERMLADCKAAGHKAVVVSAYRTNAYQAGLYQRRVQRFLDQGYSQADAEREAAMRVAVPGTSEHELGLALDIVDVDYQKLTEKQETMPAQQWLMAHCWEYGFILRYPNEKSEATGIIYEPWHYRYVGTELALELRDAGLCLEEYLDNLTTE
ncbi:MAG: D-alanyl-D-alanine carboxypeptidase family protein [Oscillospiraceae bacterium]|nr:D-alanyl-D-alanine carboxypeptidase family protein [Oscillospiraceae bacterium]